MALGHWGPETSEALVEARTEDEKGLTSRKRRGGYKPGMTVIGPQGLQHCIPDSDLH